MKIYPPRSTLLLALLNSLLSEPNNAVLLMIFRPLNQQTVNQQQSSSKLKINDSKTKFLVLTSSFFKHQFKDLQINVGNTEINPSFSARSLGVIFDSHLNLESHINFVCRSAYFHLRNIGSIRNMLTDNACSQLIYAFVTVRIDYCNSLLYGLPDCSLSRLQRILNTAAHILCKIPKFDHITKTLLDLHWLPIKQRILFKILILTYQAYHTTAHKYLCDLINNHAIF